MFTLPTDLREFEEQRLVEPFSFKNTENVENYINQTFPVYSQMQEEIYRLNKIINLLIVELNKKQNKVI